mgnify:CR=1 FL=1
MNRFISAILLLKLALANLSAQEGKITQLSSQELKEIINDNNATLIDVRTRGEFANGHISDAFNLESAMK